MIRKTIQQLLLFIILTVILIGLTHLLPSIKKFNLTTSFTIYFSLCISALLILFANGILKYMREVRYLHSPISAIDKMTGEEFEYYLKLRFEKEGFKAEMTRTSQDYGADLILKKNGETIVVQAKRYEANVGTSAIQEVVAAKEYYQADNCMVVTNSHFTINALNLAEVNDVILLDRDDLLKRTLC